VLLPCKHVVVAASSPLLSINIIFNELEVVPIGVNVTISVVSPVDDIDSDVVSISGVVVSLVDGIDSDVVSISVVVVSPVEDIDSDIVSISVVVAAVVAIGFMVKTN
jgi:hypothetical protein